MVPIRHNFRWMIAEVLSITAAGLALIREISALARATKKNLVITM
jgi:hypothetical protein